jgi:hypothetical protein
MSKKFLVVLLVIFLLFSSVGLKAITLNAAQDTLPRGIHLYWNDNVSTTMMITWKTATEDSGDTVFYDVVSRMGKEDPTKAYKFSVTGVHHTIDGLGGYIHDVKLIDLIPGQTYYFVAGGPGGYSEERKFRTIPENPKQVTFVFGSDSHSGTTFSAEAKDARDAISKLMNTYNPQFVLHDGDFVDMGYRVADYDNWFSHIAVTWIDSNGYTIPIIPNIGNHEISTGSSDEFETTMADTKWYHQYYDIPDWYSLDITPYLHFTALDSSTFTDSHSNQYIWANQDLKNAKDVTWKLVGFHIPANPQGTGGTSNFLPLLNTYHVNVVLNGHSHLYERTQPMNASLSASKYFSPEEGTIRITSGGWGGPLSKSQYPMWFDAGGPTSQYNFTLFNVSPDILHMKAIDIKNNVIDEFTIGQASSKPEVIAKGIVTNYASDVTGPATLMTFKIGTFPPIIQVKKVGKGTVAAGGIAWTGENKGWFKGEYDVFLDILFQNMVQGAKNILWYEGYNAAFTTTRCSDLIAALGDLGYKVVASNTMPITSSLIGSYDILIIPQLRLGSGSNGGDSSLLPWSDVDAIKAFVEKGKGLLVMDACDYGSNNFCNVQNKILEGVGAGITIQSDTVYDNVNNWRKIYCPIVEVDPNTEIGSEYVKRTGKLEVRMYELCSAVPSYPTDIEKVPAGKRTIINGMKAMADARVIMETNDGGEGFVRIQNLKSSSGELLVLKSVDISSDIPEDKIKWPITIELYYTDDEFKSFGLTNESSLWMYYWDSEQEAWRLCPESGVNTKRNCVVANTYRFTIFAIMGGPLRIPGD